MNHDSACACGNRWLLSHPPSSQVLIPGFVGSDVPHPIGLDMLVQYHGRAQAMSRNRTRVSPRPSGSAGAGVSAGASAPSLTASDKPVYFTRRDAKSGAARKMTNERELEKQLGALGWDILTFGDYTLLERVEVRGHVVLSTKQTLVTGRPRDLTYPLLVFYPICLPYCK